MRRQMCRNRYGCVLHTYTGHGGTGDTGAGNPGERGDGTARGSGAGDHGLARRAPDRSAGVDDTRSGDGRSCCTNPFPLGCFDPASVHPQTIAGTLPRRCD